MKKLFLYLTILIIVNTHTLSNEYQDYQLFTEAKNAYYSENYEKAKDNFEVLLRTFPVSNVFNENYAYFYIGMTYFNLKDYNKATLYLEKVTYVPTNDKLSDDSEIEKIIYFSQRDYALGFSLLELGNVEKAMIYLNRIDYTTFFPISANYEEKALELLSKYQPSAKSKLALKFNYDFSKMDDLSIDELINIGEFFISEKNYSKGQHYYEILLSKVKSTVNYNKVYEDYLKLLILDKNYNKLLKVTEKVGREQKSTAIFYRGLAFYQKKDFSRALYLFENIHHGKYYSKAKYYTASIYFALGDYKSTINVLSNIESNDLLSDNMLATSYLYVNDNKNFKKIAEKIINNYSNTYIGVYYSLLMENNNIPTRILSLNDLSLIAIHILSQSVNLPEDFLRKADSLEIQQLSQIVKFGDEDILKLTFNKRNFLEKQSLAYIYSTTTILEKGEFYSLALKNSQKYMVEFLKYKELFQYIFPRYFKDTINTCSKNYDVPQELIYTIIYNISGFDPFYTADDSKFGLMGIFYDKNKPYRVEELFNPDYNIELGTKKLKELLELYDGNRLKTLIAYIYGENYVKNIYFGNNNDINFSSITIPEERYFLENLLLTYIFYTKLYEY